jgi:YbgC/YbaW family acyl-CoA thioester hydrolase
MANAFVMRRRVQFAEVDMAGVLHFANYYRLMEEAEHAFCRSLGLTVVSHAGSDGTIWPRVSTGCEYSTPIRFDEEVELRLRVTALTDKSISYEIEFSREGRRAALGRLTTVHCTWNGHAFEPAPIPETVRAKLTALLADHA